MPIIGIPCPKAYTVEDNELDNVCESCEDKPCMKEVTSDGEIRQHLRERENKTPNKARIRPSRDIKHWVLLPDGYLKPRFMVKHRPLTGKEHAPWAVWDQVTEEVATCQKGLLMNYTVQATAINMARQANKGEIKTDNTYSFTSSS